jgi:hypothetical protein
MTIGHGLGLSNERAKVMGKEAQAITSCAGIGSVRHC